MAARSRQKSKRSKSAKARKKDRKCPHCKGGEQTFHYMHRLYLFDIDEARELVLDGRVAIELEPEDVRFSVDVSRIYPEHLDHVDTQYPGIIAHYWYPMPDGSIESGHLLIDGHHRAARCLRDEIPFFVHILSEQESRAVTLKSPNIEEILSGLEHQDNAVAELATSH